MKIKYKKKYKCRFCKKIKFKKHFPDKNPIRVGLCIKCKKSRQLLLKRNRKKCSKCHRIKPTNYFYNQYDNYLMARCKKCCKNDINYYRDNNRRKVRRIQKLWNKRNPQKGMYQSAKKRAKENNLPFNIELSDIFIPKFCPILNIKLKPSKNRMSNNSPTLDRTNNSKGYVKGNVFVISNKANRLKADGTAEQHKAIYKWMKKHKCK